MDRRKSIKALVVGTVSAGVVLDESGEEEAAAPRSVPKKAGSSEKKSAAAGSENEYASLSNEELKESLMRAIDEEAYERASKIRDELNKRKKNS